MSGLSCAGKHITLLLIQPHCALLTPLTDALKLEEKELACMCVYVHVPMCARALISPWTVSSAHVS